MLYTDGILEATNVNGMEYGTEGIIDFVRRIKEKVMKILSRGCIKMFWNILNIQMLFFKTILCYRSGIGNYSKIDKNRNLRWGVILKKKELLKVVYVVELEKKLKIKSRCGFCSIDYL